ncbi:hypothetical protein AB0D73_29085 [Streptomyces sp. NPDC048215]|uniref:hypothetical protein n=1 Tax=Streptomyces sp. NPDC048215 TaxID=3156690 RepID=UPI003407BDA0
MSRLSSPTGVRVNRPYYVPVDSRTVRDVSLTYRALGLLTYLLDQKEGWQVRSDQLSKGEGREGREAIRTALRELARKGYYRLERRRFRSGQCAMGTAVSVLPIEQWVKDYEVFGTSKNPAVPVVEQEDGSFLVEYPDGTFGSDGFTADPADEEPPADLGPEPGEQPKPVAAPSKPEPEPAAPAKPVRKRRTRRTAEQKQADDEAKAAEAEKKAAMKKALDDAAESVAKWWWAHAEKHLGAYVGQKKGYVAMRTQVRSALETGYTQKECGLALQSAKKHWPSAQQWQHALGIVTKNIQPSQPFGRVAYSDVATWGVPSQGSSSLQGDSQTTPSAVNDDADDATFGVIARS